MEYEDIKKKVNSEKVMKFSVKTVDGKKKTVRLWRTQNGDVAILNPHSRTRGHQLSKWHDKYDEWVSLVPCVSAGKFASFETFLKRAKKAQEMLTESGLWPNIKEMIDKFLEMGEDEQRDVFLSICEDSYEFYKQTFNGCKYNWCSGYYQVFESFAKRNCWKSIAWRKYDRGTMKTEVEDCIKNKKFFYKSWENGYDNSVEVSHKDGVSRAFYSEEYRGCGNGHYYLMFDATHAIFYEDD